MTDHRIITIRQPWALPVVFGIKPVENRSTHFPQSYRGHIWIHAAAAWNQRGLTDPRILRTYYPVVVGTGGQLLMNERDVKRLVRSSKFFVRSAIIGGANVADIHRSEPGCCDTEWAEHEYTDVHGQLQPEATHIVLEDAYELDDPITASGALGLWTPNPDLAAALDAAMDVA